MTAPVGKYFIGVHDGAMRSGIVEAAIDATHSVPRYQSALRGGACAGMIKRSPFGLLSFKGNGAARFP